MADSVAVCVAMRTPGEEMLEACNELRQLCARKAGDAEAYIAIAALTGRISLLGGSPEVSAASLDVRFKAEDLFRRSHLMSESILRLMLEDRMQRLEAQVRLTAGGPPERRAPGQYGRRATDRAPLGVALSSRARRA